VATKVEGKGAPKLVATLPLAPRPQTAAPAPEPANVKPPEKTLPLGQRSVLPSHPPPSEVAAPAPTSAPVAPARRGRVPLALILVVFAALLGIAALAMWHR
jgi:hypothetical protein